MEIRFSTIEKENSGQIKQITEMLKKGELKGRKFEFSHAIGGVVGLIDGSGEDFIHVILKEIKCKN